MHLSLPSAPAWSMKSRSRNKPETHQSPGPNHYSPSLANSQSAPNFKVGKALRSDFTTERGAVPGPGAYHLECREHIPLSKFGSAKRGEGTASYLNPGPGAYNPLLDSNGPMFSLRAKCQVPNSEELPGPGPGSYSSLGQDRPKSAKIGKAPRGDLPDDNVRCGFPGPGTYAFESTLSPKGYSMPGKRSSKKKEVSPGPGTYNGHPERPRSARIGTASRVDLPQESTRNAFPGPGTYYELRPTEGPQWGFGSATRPIAASEQAPGPGAYKTLVQSTPGPLFGTSTRAPLSMTVETPGPGSYAANSGQHGRGWTMASRYQEKGTEKSPGPGAYTSSARPSSACYSVGRSKKNTEVQEQAHSPGPGGYNYNPMVSNIAYSISGRVLPKNAQEAPGPGQYNPGKKGATPTWKFGSSSRSAKRELEDARQTPGPGMYDTRGKLAGPRWAMGREQRAKKRKESAPGPGTYQVVSSIGNLPSYALSGANSASRAGH